MSHICYTSKRFTALRLPPLSRQHRSGGTKGQQCKKNACETHLRRVNGLTLGAAMGFAAWLSTWQVYRTRHAHAHADLQALQSLAEGDDLVKLAPLYDTTVII